MTTLRRVRLQLAGWNLLVQAAVLALTLGVAMLSASRAVARATEQELDAVVSRAVARAEHLADHEGRDRDGDDDEDDDAVIRAPGAIVFLRFRSSPEVRSNLRLAPEGLPLTRSLDAAFEGRSTREERAPGGEAFLVRTEPVWHQGRVVASVQAAKSLRGARRALARTLAALVGTGLAGLALAAWASWFLAGRAMRPIGEAMERQRRFLADASHELRTPAAVVRARAELLEREGDALPPATREALARLHGDARELSSLLDTLLDLSRLEAREAALSLGPVALGDVVEELSSQLLPLASERGVTLTARAAPVWAIGDLTRVRQVLRALADNALKHTPRGGHVCLEVEREGDRARLTVTDDGEGIAPEHLPRVFDRFYRADASRTGRGAGLGLAIARELVEGQHGELWLESEPGRGTRAIVLLPLAPVTPGEMDIP